MTCEWLRNVCASLRQTSRVAAVGQPRSVNDGSIHRDSSTYTPGLVPMWSTISTMSAR